MDYSHRHLEVCGSTNDEARTWAADPDDPAPDLACLTASAQTAGRGRHGRRWDADTGVSAILSIVVRPPDGSGVWAMGLAAAVAVAEAVEQLGGRALLKWPNDVLVDGRKAAGVLVEASSNPPVVVVGIGVNVGQASFPDEETYAFPPTSLFLSLGRSIDPADVAQTVVDRFRHWELVRRQLGARPIVDAWRARIASGVPIRSGAVEGRLQDILGDGRALVALPDGTQATLTSVDTA